MSIFDVVRDPTFVGGKTRTFVRKASDISDRERFDAGTHDPKYDRFFKLLRKSGSTVRLGDHLKEPAKRGVQPSYDANGMILVINSQQVHADKIDIESCSYTTPELVTANRNRGKIKKYDVLINSTGYITIGRCQCYLYDDSAIVDSHITILRPKPMIDPVYLSVFLNSRLGYFQTERSWTGSSGQVELRKECIADFVILVPEMDIQQQIRKSVEQAHEAKEKSRRLLAKATASLEDRIFAK